MIFLQRMMPWVPLMSITLTASAQFPPPAGQPGTTAMHKDSSAFVAWATGCVVVRGPQDISDPELGLASVGVQANVVGMPNGNVLSLGDGGMATLTFAQPIINGPGWDFAVFENGFNDIFLELAFVEVSSNGADFYRFPATSLTQTDTQIDGFGAVDATKIDNLAGKYRAQFGTPFDLEQLAGEPGLDVDAITHVRIVDVVGCIQDAYATHDHLGNKVNDPWNTPFASSGFDLDGVGVVHQLATNVDELFAVQLDVRLFPNPAEGRSTLYCTLSGSAAVGVTLSDATGRVARRLPATGGSAGRNRIVLDLEGLPAGLYFVSITTDEGHVSRPLIVQ
jgi:hypothetical protein